MMDIPMVDSTMIAAIVVAARFTGVIKISRSWFRNWIVPAVYGTGHFPPARDVLNAESFCIGRSERFSVGIPSFQLNGQDDFVGRHRFLVGDPQSRHVFQLPLAFGDSLALKRPLQVPEKSAVRRHACEQ